MPNKLTQQEVEQKILSLSNNQVAVASFYLNKRAPLRLLCLECGNEWETTFHNVGYSTFVRCNKCYAQKTTVYCAYCEKELHRSPSDIKASITKLFYCSRECGNRHKNQLREESGEWDNTTNYRRTAFLAQEHKCVVCGWDEDERILEVHHIDENRTNNLTDNLIILCPTCHRKITLGYYYLNKNKLLERSLI